MGYECILHYHEEISKGEYNKEETKTKSIKIGSPYDDIPLEMLAGKIMAQLARRNMLVIDVEIFEFAKKKISYKETEDGILIKNKKFGFDDDRIISNSLNVSFAEEEVSQAAPVPQIERKALPVNSSEINKKMRPIRYEIFNPMEPYFINMYKDKKMAFTLNKKYPIFTETAAGSDILSGMNYLTEDDRGVRRTVNDKFFTPIVNLSGFEDPISEQQDIRLSGNFIEDAQEVILRR